MIKKYLSFKSILVFSLFLVLFAGVSFASDDIYEGVDEITFTYWAEDPVRIEFFENMWAPWEERTGVKVNGIPIPYSDYPTKLQTMFAGNQAPDVMRVVELNVRDFHEFGALLPLNEYINEEEMTDRLYGQKMLNFEGDIVGLTFFYKSMLMNYNTELFSEAGLEPAYDTWRRGEWDWDYYIEAGKKITQDVDGDGQPDQYMHATSLVNDPFGIETIMRSFGREPWAEDGSKSNFNTEEGIEVLKLAKDMIHKWGILPHPEEDVEDMGINFEGGNMGTLLDHWATPANASLRESKGDPVWDCEWDSVMVPEGPAGHIPSASVAPISVSSSTEHPEVAVDFALWMTSKEMTDHVVTEAKLRPIHSNKLTVWDSTYWSLFPGVRLDVVTQTLDTPYMPRAIANQSKVNRELVNQLESILKEKTTVEEGVANLDKTMEEIIGR